jgi:hypothetical protein
MMHFTPAAAIAFAISNPIPLLPPVITASFGIADDLMSKNFQRSQHERDRLCSLQSSQNCFGGIESAERRNQFLR